MPTSSRNRPAAGISQIQLLERRQLLSASPLPIPSGSTKLKGSIIGTAGSYRSQGNTIANAMDGNPNTFFDAPTQGPSWVGLDLGAPEMVTQVQYLPRNGFASRMVGGAFQGSSTADFSTDVSNLFTVSASPAVGVFSAAAVTTGLSFRYVRYLAPASGWGNVAELEFDGTLATPANLPAKLTGTVIGTTGSYRNLGNSAANAFDGDASTFFDAPAASGCWAGLDLGAPQVITQVCYQPRSHFAGRMVGGSFQASNSADFSSGVMTIYTINSTPQENVMTAVAVSTPGAYRYVRYLSPAGGSCNVAELQFAGFPEAVTLVTPVFPTSLSAWSSLAPSPIVRAEAVGAAVNGKLYVFGGFNNQGSDTTSIPLQNRCDAYDPATNTWTQVASFPEPFTHSDGVVVGNDIWFVGGYIGNHPGPGTTHVWVYDTVANSWSRGPDLPQARGAGASALVGNTIYFSGGMDATRTIDENTTYALNLANLTAGWTQLADLPNARNHVAGAGLGGFFYVLGGQHGQEDGQIAQSEVDRYDPSTNTWTPMSPLPMNAGKSHITAGTFVFDGRIIVVGGETGYDDPQRSIIDYDPVSNTWNSLGLLPAARSTVIAGIIGNDLIVATGNGPSATNTNWSISLN